MFTSAGFIEQRDEGIQGARSAVGGARDLVAIFGSNLLVCSEVQ